MIEIRGAPVFDIVSKFQRNLAAVQVGRFVYTRDTLSVPLEAHEYIHQLQAEAYGTVFFDSYWAYFIRQGGGIGNRFENLGYLWQGWLETFGNWATSPGHYERPPWLVWIPFELPLGR